MLLRRHPGLHPALLLRLHAGLRFGGTLASPLLNGELRVSNGELDAYQINLALREVNFSAVLRDNTHLYAAVLKERDLLDLANFVSAGQVNMDTAIDRATRRARGDARRAAAYYGTICASCHGIDGNRIITAPSLGTVARANPWESLHKIANGHPNEKMPALRELDPQVQADILAFLQGLPEIR